MKAYIDVKDENERDLIGTALSDPSTRALVLMMGALLPLSEASRATVLNKVVQELEIDL